MKQAKELEDIIFKELNEWVFRVETQAGEKLNVVEDCDFKEIIKNIKNKLLVCKTSNK